MIFLNYWKGNLSNYCISLQRGIENFLSAYNRIWNCFVEAVVFHRSRMDTLRQLYIFGISKTIFLFNFKYNYLFVGFLFGATNFWFWSRWWRWWLRKGIKNNYLLEFKPFLLVKLLNRFMFWSIMWFCNTLHFETMWREHYEETHYNDEYRDSNGCNVFWCGYLSFIQSICDFIHSTFDCAKEICPFGGIGICNGIYVGSPNISSIVRREWI